MSKVIRSVKNVTKGYSSAQVKVREATSNDPWGPTGTQMSEIAQLTFNSSTEFYDIMDMLDKRLNDKGKNWRHVLKALKVMDYSLHEGSELVITWAKQNIFVIKTLREFIYIDEEGRDVGQNVRVAAKELTSLIMDEGRLRAERSDRRSWKSRVTGLEEYAPQQLPQRPRQRPSDEEDAEYKLAIEASKYQAEEDRRKRESRGAVDDDDDLAKAIKLSKEEEERRKREVDELTAASLFDNEPVQSQTQYTGFNQGYQQGSAVDFFANPIEQNQMQMQPTGYLGNTCTGVQNGYTNGFQAQPTGYNPYAQQQQFALQTQNTGFIPYAQQQQVQSPLQEPLLQPGSNNPWASNNSQQQAIKPMQTGSNNPFAQQQQSFNRPSSFKSTSMPMPSLGSLPEQSTVFSFPSLDQQPQQQQQQQQQQQPKPISEHERKLNALLASGDGLDTFGNTGDLRIPAQHTAPGTFVNSSGANISRLTAEKTGNNPFLRQQSTGISAVPYHQQLPAATGPAGSMNGYSASGTSNPFGTQRQQQSNQGDLIQF